MSQEGLNLQAAYLPYALSVLRMSSEKPVELEQNFTFSPKKLLAGVYHDCFKDAFKLITGYT